MADFAIAVGVLAELAIILAFAADNTWLRARCDRLTAGLPAQRRPRPEPSGAIALPEITGVTDAWLDAWDREVDGLPWGYACAWSRPADVWSEVDELGAVVYRLIPERPSTGMVRRIVAGNEAA